MRTLVLLGWLMVPVVAGAYHYGPGQEKLRLDDVSRVLADADRLAAAAGLASRLVQVRAGPDDVAGGPGCDARRIRLQRAKVQMFGHQLPEANAALRELVDQIEDDKSADPKVRDEARETLANAQYYMTWLMRLEGLGAQEWEPEIESARQTYRLLAEQAEAAGDPESARKHREDLESAIRLWPGWISATCKASTFPSSARTARAASARSQVRSLGRNPERARKRKTPARPARGLRRITRARERHFSTSRGLHHHGRSARHLIALLRSAPLTVVLWARPGAGAPPQRPAPRREALQTCRLRSLQGSPAGGKPGMPDPAEAKKQEHLQKIQQLTFDRRPSSILKAWSTPREEA